jgi:hypothetical protein
LFQSGCDSVLIMIETAEGVSRHFMSVNGGLSLR